jgi:hypothetical protein
MFQGGRLCGFPWSYIVTKAHISIRQNDRGGHWAVERFVANRLSEDRPRPGGGIGHTQALLLVLRAEEI